MKYNIKVNTVKSRNEKRRITVSPTENINAPTTLLSAAKNTAPPKEIIKPAKKAETRSFNIFIMHHPIYSVGVTAHILYRIDKTISTLLKN